MLPDDERVDIPAVYPQFASEKLFQTGRVQYRARADHPFPGIARQLPGYVGQHVHRIGYHQQNASELPCCDLLYDGFQDYRIPSDQVQPALPRFLIGARRHHNQAAVCDVIIVPCRNLHRRAVGQTVPQIHGLPFGPLFVDVHQHQLVAQVLV